MRATRLALLALAATGYTVTALEAAGPVNPPAGYGCPGPAYQLEAPGPGHDYEAGVWTDAKGDVVGTALAEDSCWLPVQYGTVPRVPDLPPSPHSNPTEHGTLPATR